MLVRPCTNCPFRNDKPFYLGRRRRIEIAESLRRGAEFSCHKTTVQGDNDEVVRSGDEKFCAGAMIVLEKSEGPNQMMRIAERLGMYDYSKLKMESPVYDSLEEFCEGDPIPEPEGQDKR